MGGSSTTVKPRQRSAAASLRTDLLGEAVEHAGRDGRRVRPQDVLLRLLELPRRPVADRPVAAGLVHRLDTLQVVRRELARRRGLWGDGGREGGWTRSQGTAGRGGRVHERAGVRHTAQEEGVMGVARRVLLRLEQRVKVPERALHKVVGRHLGEAVCTAASIRNG